MRRIPTGPQFAKEIKKKVPFKPYSVRLNEDHVKDVLKTLGDKNALSYYLRGLMEKDRGDVG